MNVKLLTIIALTSFIFLLLMQPLFASTYNKEQIRQEMISKEAGTCNYAIRPTISSKIYAPAGVQDERWEAGHEIFSHLAIFEDFEGKPGTALNNYETVDENVKSIIGMFKADWVLIVDKFYYDKSSLGLYYGFKYMNKCFWIKDNDYFGILDENVEINYATPLYAQVDYKLIKRGSLIRGEVVRYLQQKDNDFLAIFSWVEKYNGQKGYILRPYDIIRKKIAEQEEYGNWELVKELKTYANIIAPKSIETDKRTILERLKAYQGWTRTAHDYLEESGIDKTIIKNMAEILQYETGIWLEKKIKLEMSFSGTILRPYAPESEAKFHELKNKVLVLVAVPIILEDKYPYTYLGNVYVIFVYKKDKDGTPLLISKDSKVYLNSELSKLPSWWSEFE